MRHYMAIALWAPQRRLVMQRRDGEAEHAAGQLGFFGGDIEGNEHPELAARRELAEETSLDAQGMKLRRIGAFVIPAASGDIAWDRHFHVYEAKLPSADFYVYEGSGAEAYRLGELRQRDDINTSAHYLLNEVQIF